MGLFAKLGMSGGTLHDGLGRAGFALAGAGLLALILPGALPGAAARAGTAAPPTAASWRVTAAFPPVTTDAVQVACGSPAVCQVVGESVSRSGLLRTGDGGRSWAADALPANVTGVAGPGCGATADCQVAAAVRGGGAGAILGTANGGRTWVTETVPGGTFPFTVACGSALDCQALGNTATLSTVVLGTTDGGKKWASETIPASVSLSAIACGSALDCQATGAGNSGGVILGTADGGKTWVAEKSPAGTSPGPIACGSALNCQALATVSGGGYGVLGTSDGGKTWHTEQIPAGVAGLAGIGCGSPLSCQAVGQAQAGTGSGVPGGGLAIGTVNGGKTWAAEKLPAGISVLLGVGCRSATACQAVGEGTASLGVLIGTATGGTSWTAERLPLEFSSINDLACGSSQSCQAAGVSGYGTGVVLGSADSGTSWTREKTPGRLPAFASVACASAAACQAAGYGFILRTGDGGKTWRHDKLPAGVAAVNAVACPAATACQAAGQTRSGQGTMLGTGDGGMSWIAEKLPTGVSALWSVTCGSGTGCQAAGVMRSGTRVMVRTGNGGKTWSVDKLPAAVTGLTAVACGSAARCQAIGGTGPGRDVVLGTTDGGTSWTAEKLPAQVSVLNGIACASPLVCQTIGGTSSGTDIILGTGDGGKTWALERLPAGITGLSAIACSPAGSCQAAGWNRREGAVLLRFAGSGAAHPAVSPLFRAASVTWTSSQQGWALGAAPCGSKTCTDLIGTTDGGGSWGVLSRLPAAIPVFGKPTSNIVTEIRFATPGTGWAFGPDLYLTRTGGRSWTRQPIPGGGKQILALAASATTAYAVVSPCVFQQGTCGKPLSLWRTSTHSPSSWHRVTLSLPSNFTAQVVVSGATVYVVDPQVGHDLFYASTDNGRRFAARPVPCDRKADTGLASVAATSATQMDLLCVGNPGLGKADKYVFRSADTGKTDSYAGTLGVFGITCQLAASPAGNLAVACVSAPGSFLYVNDTGKRAWKMAVGYGDGGAGWDDITYLNDTQAWVVYAPYSFIGGVGKLFVTRDGGRHWNFITP